MGYPNTELVSGAVDPAFGGVEANRFGTIQHTFQDAQIRELQRQSIDQWWSGRPLQYLPIKSGGIAGDAIVFDSNPAIPISGPSYATVPSVTFDVTATPIIGILLEPVSASAKGRVCTGGGWIPSNITGLSGTSKGPVTFDQTTGRLRIATVGEPVYGICDQNGNCHLFAVVPYPAAAP